MFLRVIAVPSRYIVKKYRILQYGTEAGHRYDYGGLLVRKEFVG